MENFNKFLQEEDEMEMESDADESGIDNILDDILDDMLEEGVLKEFGPVSGEDMAEFEGSNETPKTPSKEEVKSGIKTALKEPEVKTVLDKIESSAKEKMGDIDDSEVKAEALSRGIAYALKQHALELHMAAFSVPALGSLFGFMGSSATPHHSIIHTVSQSTIDAMASSGTERGLIIGALIGAAFLGKAAVTAFKTAKKQSGDQYDQLSNLSPEEYEKDLKQRSDKVEQDERRQREQAAAEKAEEKAERQFRREVDSFKRKQDMERFSKKVRDFMGK